MMYKIYVIFRLLFITYKLISKPKAAVRFDAHLTNFIRVYEYCFEFKTLLD